MIQSALVARLESVSGVTSIAADRIYPLMIPQHVYSEATKQPCIVYTRTNVQRRPTFCTSVGLIATGFRVDSYARTYVQAVELAAAVKTALIDFTGSWGSPAQTISRVMLDNEFDLLDPEPGLYRVSQTYTVWHIE
jgi:hypothetical protein